MAVFSTVLWHFILCQTRNLHIFANGVNGAFVLDYFQLCIDVFLLVFGQKWNKERPIHWLFSLRLRKLEISPASSVKAYSSVCAQTQFISDPIRVRVNTTKRSASSSPGTLRAGRRCWHAIHAVCTHSSAGFDWKLFLTEKNIIRLLWQSAPAERERETVTLTLGSSSVYLAESAHTDIHILNISLWKVERDIKKKLLGDGRSKQLLTTDR